jgi:hypothetical protein
MATTTDAVNASLYERLSYNFIRDVAPVARVARFMQTPERAGQPVIMGRPMPALFDDGCWTDAARAFGEERASRRMRADGEVRKMRDDPFAATAAEIHRHFDRTLQAIHDAAQEQNWRGARELTQWQEARESLMRDADAPLPPS